MRQLKVILLVALVALLALPSATVPAASDRRVRANLTGFEETPVTLFSPASGRFRARIRGDKIEFELSFEGLPTRIQQAHIHFGARATTGGISVWLCQTPGFVDPTSLSATCPQSGTVTGTITAANVVGPAGQGIGAGEFNKLVEAIRAGVTYANVHTEQRPGGEIRGQIDDRRRRGDD